MIFLSDGLDARLRHCHIKYERNLLMTDKALLDAPDGKILRAFQGDPDFSDVLRFYILLQAPGERPANNLTSIIFKEGAKGIGNILHGTGRWQRFLRRNDVTSAGVAAREHCLGLQVSHRGK